MPPPPPAPPPPTFSVANTDKPKLNNNESKGRNQLLLSIQGGSRLKSSKHLMVDKSGPSLSGKKPGGTGGGGQAARPGMPCAPGMGSGVKRPGFPPSQQAKEPAQSTSGPGLGGLFAGGMPTLRKTGQRTVNTGASPSPGGGKPSNCPAPPFKPSSASSGPAPFKATPTPPPSTSNNRTGGAGGGGVAKKWPTVNPNSASNVKLNAKSIADKFAQNSVSAPPPPPPHRAPSSGPPAPNTNRSQGAAPPPPLRNISKSPQPPPPPQRAAPSPNFAPKVPTNAAKSQQVPPPPPARAPSSKPPPPPPSRSAPPSIQRTPSVNSVNMRNGSATAHPPNPPSRNSRHSIGSNLPSPSPGYATSLGSYDIDFEKKFSFVDLANIPAPKSFQPTRKTYPSKHRNNPALNNTKTRSVAPSPPPR